MRTRIACGASVRCGRHQQMMMCLLVHGCASNAVFDTEGGVGNTFNLNVRMINNSLNTGSQ